MIEGKTEIRNPEDSCFLLAKNLKIQHITADGKPVLFRQKPSDSSEYSTEIIIRANQLHTLVIDYSGQINPDSFPKMISMLNMIKSGLVELSERIDWYPQMKNHKSFSYKLDVDVPVNYISVANGLLLTQQTKNNRNLTEWESTELRNTITLISAADLRKSEITKDGKTIEIYYTKLPVTYIDSMKTNLLKSIELLTGLFGSPGAGRLIRIVYSPRSETGYCREPLIIVSENFALNQRGEEFGPARDFRLNTHEIAHYWSLADSDSPDEWINEGLAEFSALLVSKEIIGKSFYDLLIHEYRELVSHSQTITAIADRGLIPIEREANLYCKPTLLLDDLWHRSGDEKMRQFLKDSYSRFTELHMANTSVFLEEMEKIYGKETRDSFSVALYRRNSKTVDSLGVNYYASSDSAFKGTWTGPLTQYGSTLKFVLNITLKDGKLIPTLDSPDQNVKGIPINEFNIAADSLSFKVSVASASYDGKINRDGNTIYGEWKQKGIIFPLVLSKAGRVE